MKRFSLVYTEASLENGVQPVCDHIARSDGQNPNLFKEGNFSNEV